jgi:hypothetical protein
MRTITENDVINWMQDVLPESVTPEDFIRGFADDFGVDISPASLSLSEKNKALKEALKKSHEATRYYIDELKKMQMNFSAISEILDRNN